MRHGDFIWCDLSAYDPAVAMRFYSDTLGWSWSDDGTGTHLAWRGNDPVASLYQMPKAFMDMNMPSFWMSYVAVQDVAETVAKAKSLGGIVELGPAEFQPGSQYALIRDPLGAGFTVVDNPPQAGADTGPGARIGHALFVSDAKMVSTFYNALFGWLFEEAQDGVWAVYHNGVLLFHCHEIPDPAVRGKEQYWSVLFQCSDPLHAAERSGAEVLADFDLPEGRAVLGRDPQSAAFFLVEA